MESNLKEKLQNEIMTKTLKFTQSRIEKNISEKHNDDFIDESLKSFQNKYHRVCMAVHTILSSTEIKKILSRYEIGVLENI